MFVALLIVCLYFSHLTCKKVRNFFNYIPLLFCFAFTSTYSMRNSAMHHFYTSFQSSFYYWRFFALFSSTTLLRCQKMFLSVKLSYKPENNTKRKECIIIHCSYLEFRLYVQFKKCYFSKLFSSLNFISDDHIRQEKYMEINRCGRS